MIARLGLRVNEATNLSLDDIDWRGGELTPHRASNEPNELMFLDLARSGDREFAEYLQPFGKLVGGESLLS